MCFVIEGIFDILVGIGALVAVVFACTNVAQPDSLAKYFTSTNNSAVHSTYVRTKYLQDVAQYVAISGYFFNIFILIIVTPIIIVCKQVGTRSALWLLVLLLIASLISSFANIAALVLAVFATNQFNADMPSLMKGALTFSNDLTIDSNNDTLSCAGADDGPVLWNKMQFEKQCCGVDGLSDYDSEFTNSTLWSRSRTNAIAPLTCCQHYTQPVTDSCTVSGLDRSCVSDGDLLVDYVSQGCFTVLQNVVVSNEIVVVVMSCFVVTQVFFTIFVRMFTGFYRHSDD